MTTSPPPDPVHPHEPFRGDRPGGIRSARPTQAGDGPGWQRGPVPAPPQLKRLLRLTAVSAGLYVLNVVVVLVLLSTIDITALYRRIGFPAEQAEQAGAMFARTWGVSVASNLVGVLAILGLYVLVYVFLRRGANWARILGIVLAGLAMVSFLVSIISNLWLHGSWAVVSTAIAVALIAVNVAWVVTAVQDPLRHWFHRVDGL